MSLTFNSKTYTADSFAQNAVGYVGAAKSVSSKDDLILRRTAPKPTSTLSGVGRTEAKLTRTVVLTGALTPTWDLIVDVSVSVPVGVASADVDAALNDVGALVSSASFKTHVKAQQINY
nr:MAG: coat protein [Leviviridae sp.]